MTTQATANQLKRPLWLLVVLAAGLNGCTGEPFEQVSDNVTAVTTQAPIEGVARSALTRAFREQASDAARITRAEVTAELAERMEQDRSTLLAGTDPRNRGKG
jgi:type IV pilus biogenesis protein CpaD/CtpE